MENNIPVGTIWSNEFVRECLKELSKQPRPEDRKFIIYVTSKEDMQRKLSFGYRKEELVILPKLK